jgi:hypothetical protein
MKTDIAPSFDPRNKVVSFRLSDNEYEFASDFCKASGFRGMSMLARSAFLAYLPQTAEKHNHQDDPAILQAELRTLHSELARLIASLSKIREHIVTEDRPEEVPMTNDRVMAADHVA